MDMVKLVFSAPAEMNRLWLMAGHSIERVLCARRDEPNNIELSGQVRECSLRPQR